MPGATARALGRAGSLQRVHRAVLKFARRHSEGAVARAILAEGSSGALQIRTAPQWERFEARDPCRGFIGHSTNTRNVENDRGLTKSRMNTPHTANIDAGSHADFEDSLVRQLVFEDASPSRTCGRPASHKSYKNSLCGPCMVVAPLLGNLTIVVMTIPSNLQVKGSFDHTPLSTGTHCSP